MEPVNSFYKVVPPEMIHPWKNNLSEIRVYDVKAKNLKEHLPVAGCSTHVSDREQSCASSIGPVTSTPIGPVAEVLDSVLSPIKRE